MSCEMKISDEYLAIDLLELFSPAGRLQSILDQLDVGQDVEQFEGTTLRHSTSAELRYCNILSVGVGVLSYSFSNLRKN